MATPIVMPKLGLTMETGTVVAWLVTEGSLVLEGQVIAEVETDKIATEVECPVDGTFLRTLVDAGSEVDVLTVIAIVGTPDENIDSYLGAADGPSPAREEPDEQTTEHRPQATEPEGGTQPKGREHPPVSPRARRLLKANGLTVDDIGAVSAARITEVIVQQHLDKIGRSGKKK